MTTLATGQGADTKQRNYFPTTHWSLVAATRRNETTRVQAALDSLCRAYWYPLYAYARRRGYTAEDAEDLTQEFFARVIEGHWFGRAERAKGRLRTFLLTAMERFLANEWARRRALKRGGGMRDIPLQLDDAETRYGVDPADTRTPEQDFEYRWALTLLGEVVSKLESQFTQRGQADLFAALKPCLVGASESQPYVELGVKLGLEEGAVKAAVHRMRQQYRELLRAEITNTVTSPEEVDGEMRHLFKVLAR